MIDAVLERLTQLHPKVIDLSLDRVMALLNRLGNPQDKLPPVIHVAGTNGKGSTIATLRALLEAAGKRVHVYTSPHLVRFAERIRIDGQLPSDDQLLALLEEVEAKNAAEPVTFFEVTTAAAFLAFSRNPADFVILETGLGGRLDATNVVANPTLTVLAPIAMDHESFLGNTLAAIAGEKAGILKQDVPVISNVQTPEALGVITKRAAQLNAHLTLGGRDFLSAKMPDGKLHYQGRHDWHLPPPALAGDFQYQNAGLALACFEALGEMGLVQVSSDIAALGLQSISWPARLQRLKHGPLVDMLPPGVELWLDGGHNPHAGQAIAQFAANWQDAPLFGIFGILANKDARGYLAPMRGKFECVYGVGIPGEASAVSAEEAAQLAQEFFKSQPAHSPQQAITTILAQLPNPAPKARILICGSLYLAGQILAENG